MGFLRRTILCTVLYKYGTKVRSNSPVGPLVLSYLRDLDAIPPPTLIEHVVTDVSDLITDHCTSLIRDIGAVFTLPPHSHLYTPRVVGSILGMKLMLRTQCLRGLA